jgi:hypothetical protein
MAVHNMTFVDGKYRFVDAGKAYFLYSDDGGITWNENVQVLHFPDENNKNGLQEPGVIELPDGRLYGYFRTDADCQYRVFRDGGKRDRSAPVALRVAAFSDVIRKNPYSKILRDKKPYRDDPRAPCIRATATLGGATRSPSPRARRYKLPILYA